MNEIYDALANKKNIQSIVQILIKGNKITMFFSIAFNSYFANHQTFHAPVVGSTSSPSCNTHIAALPAILHHMKNPGRWKLFISKKTRGMAESMVRQLTLQGRFEHGTRLVSFACLPCPVMHDHRLHFSRTKDWNQHSILYIILMASPVCEALE